MLKVFETVAQDGLIRLPGDVPSTAHCVVAILEEDLEAIREQAALVLSETKQSRMSELLAKHREGTLNQAESEELDMLGVEFDTATLIKGRALAALAHLDRDSHRG
jgi:hypothetical protein